MVYSYPTSTNAYHSIHTYWDYPAKTQRIGLHSPKLPPAVESTLHSPTNDMHTATAGVTVNDVLPNGMEGGDGADGLNGVPLLVS